MIPDQKVFYAMSSKERKKARSRHSSRHSSKHKHKHKSGKSKKKDRSKELFEPLYILDPGPSQFAEPHPPVGYYPVVQGPLYFHPNTPQPVWNPYQPAKKQIVLFSDRLDDTENPPYIIGGSQAYDYLNERSFGLQGEFLNSTHVSKVDPKRTTSAPRYVTQVSVYDEPYENTLLPPITKVYETRDYTVSSLQLGKRSSFQRGTNLGPSGYQSNAGVMGSEFYRGTNIAPSGYQSNAGLMGSEFYRGTNVAPSGYQSNAGLMGSEFYRGTNVVPSGYQSNAGLMGSEFYRGTNLAPSGYQSNAGLMASEIQRGTALGASNYQRGTGLTTNDFERSSDSLKSNYQSRIDMAASVFPSETSIMAANMQNDAEDEPQRTPRLTAFGANRLTTLRRSSPSSLVYPSSISTRSTSKPKKKGFKKFSDIFRTKSKRQTKSPPPNSESSYESLEDEVVLPEILKSRISSQIPISVYEPKPSNVRGSNEHPSVRRSSRRSSRNMEVIPATSYLSTYDITEVNPETIISIRPNSIPGLIRTEDVINDLYGRLKDIRSCLCPSSFSVPETTIFPSASTRVSSVPRGTQSLVSMPITRNYCCPCIKPIYNCCCCPGCRK